MRIVQDFDPTVSFPNTGSVFPFAIHASVKSHMVVINESNANGYLNFPNGQTAYIPANDRRIFCLAGLMQQPSDGIYKFQVQSFIPNVNNVDHLVVEVYDPGEQIVENYPNPVVRQSNVGNSVSTSSVQTFSNEGNPVNTLVGDAGPSGFPQLFQLFNDHFIWSVLQGSTSHTVLQGQTSGNPLLIGKAGDISEVLGTLQADQAVLLPNNIAIQSKDAGGTLRSVLFENGSNDIILKAGGDNNFIFQDSNGNQLFIVGTGGVVIPNNKSYIGQTHLGANQAMLGINTTDDTIVTGNVNVYLNTGAGDSIFFQINGTTEALIDNRGFVASSNASQGYTFGSGGFLPNLSFFTGTGSGTYNHGFGSAPFWVAPIVDTSGSATQGYDTVTSTQVHVTLGASLAFKAACM